MGSSLTKGTVRVQVRKDTASNWTTANPTLAVGEFGFETDTGKLKIGDGSTAWTSLAYIGGDTQYHYQIHQWYAGSGVTDFYLPFGASVVESINTTPTSSQYDDLFWIAPFSGKLVAAYMIFDNAPGVCDFKMRQGTTGQDGSLRASLMLGGTVDASSAGAVYTFTCDQNNTFNAGEVINLQLDITAKTDQALVSTKWEID